LISNQAYIATLLGLDKQRVKLLKQAQEIAIATTGKGSLDYLYPTVEMAAHLIEAEDYEKAFPLLRSIETDLKKYSESEPGLLLIFMRLNIIRLFEERQIDLVNRAIDEAIKLANENVDIHFAESIRGMSSVILILGALDQVEKGRELLKIVEAHVRKRRSHTVEISGSLGRMGILNLHIGEADKAFQYLLKAVELAIGFMDSEQFKKLNQRAQRNFKLTSAWLFNSYFHLAMTNQIDANEVSDVALYWKGSIALNNIDSQQRKLTTEQVAMGLPAGSTFINFIEFSKSEFNPPNVSLRYESKLLAIVVEAGKKTRYCELCKTDEVKRLVGQWLKGTSSAKATAQHQLEASRAATKLKSLIWDPINLDLAKDARVFISPDSLLGSFAFDALPSEHGNQFLIEDYRILTVPIPRLAVASADVSGPKIKNELLAFGNIDYGKFVRTGGQTKSRFEPVRSIFNGGAEELNTLTHSK